ncbi:MAG: hypothetical protein JXR94_08535, partial [Candidatus Hydrogenedentes bacterium]|nr:hypothetical protein [Candidatus Hydrogenedentota bacterium]
MRRHVLSAIALAVCCTGLAVAGAEPADSAWSVTVDPGRPLAPVPACFAGVNVNRSEDMLLGRPDFDEAVAGLHVAMMRFQVPNASLDYRESAAWTDETFATLDEAVEKARTVWGVQRLLFGIHRLSLPVQDGRFVEEEFPVYAEACARLVERYAPPGNLRVEYWEPFNEEDHPKHLEAL